MKAGAVVRGLVIGAACAIVAAITREWFSGSIDPASVWILVSGSYLLGALDAGG